MIYVQIAIHLHATIKLLTVPVGVTDTECMHIVPELTSKQDAKGQGPKAGAVRVEAEPARDCRRAPTASLPAIFPLWRAHLAQSLLLLRLCSVMNSRRKLSPDLSGQLLRLLSTRPHHPF